MSAEPGEDKVAVTYISVHEGILRAADRAICLAIEYAEMAEQEIAMGLRAQRFMRVVKADIEEMKETRASLNGAIERTLL